MIRVGYKVFDRCQWVSQSRHGAISPVFSFWPVHVFWKHVIWFRSAVPVRLEVFDSATNVRWARANAPVTTFSNRVFSGNVILFEFFRWPELWECPHCGKVKAFYKGVFFNLIQPREHSFHFTADMVDTGHFFQTSNANMSVHIRICRSVGYHVSGKSIKVLQLFKRNVRQDNPATPLIGNRSNSRGFHLIW